MTIATEAERESEAKTTELADTLPLGPLSGDEAAPSGMRLGVRLSLLIASLLVGCLSLALAFATWRANKVTRQKMQKDLEAVPAIYNSFEGSAASARRQQVRSLADQPGTKALLAETSVSPETFYDSALEFEKNLGAGMVLLVDANGSLLARSDRPLGQESGRDFSGVTWVRDPLTKRVESWAYILDVKRRRGLFLLASAPVIQGGGREQSTNGVLAAGFPMDDARATELGRMLSGEVAFVANLAPRGAPPEVFVLAATPRLKDLSVEGVLRSVGGVEALFGKEASSLEFSAGGEDYIGRSIPIRTGGGEAIGAVIAARSKNLELATFRAIRREIIWIGILVLMVSLPISLALARRVSQPIEQLAAGAEAIRSGQLDIPLPKARGDEVGVLARAFASMVTELKQKAALEAWVAEILRRPGDVTVGSRATPLGEASLPGLDVGRLFAKRYYVLSILGKGGMGTVYRVHDKELDEEIALKVLSQDGQDSPDGDVLRHETRLARMITHPNVVRAFDLGESDGLRFLTMEYVPGTTLSELLERRGRMDLAPGLQIAKQICRGLAAVHKAGVVHGDLKPRNVMVMANGVVKLMDFGVARPTRTETREDGPVVGSLHYMSPEQARGATLAPQSDLYSAGVALFEMFTGRRPFESDDPSALLRMHLHDAAPDPRTLRPELPETLCQAIVACLAKSQVQRPATAGDLERALLRVRA